MATVKTIPSTTFQPPSMTTASFTMPSKFNTLIAQFTISATDAADPTQSFSFELDRFDSGSSQFVFDNGFTWVGGLINTKTGQPFQPSITVDCGPLAGQTCQVKITNSKAITMSAVITSA